MTLSITERAMSEAMFREAQAAVTAASYMMAEVWSSTFGVSEDVGRARLEYMKWSKLAEHAFPPEMEGEFRERAKRSLEELKGLAAGQSGGFPGDPSALPWKRG